LPLAALMPLVEPGLDLLQAHFLEIFADFVISPNYFVKGRNKLSLFVLLIKKLMHL